MPTAISTITEAKHEHVNMNDDAPMKKQNRILKKKSIFDEHLILETLSRLNLSPIHAKKYLLQANSNVHTFMNDGKTGKAYQTIKDLHQIPQLPKVIEFVIYLICEVFLAELERDYVITTSRVVSESLTADGSTTKLLIELQDGFRVESVIMRYGHVQLDSFPDQERLKRKNQKSNDSTSLNSKLNSKEFSSNRRATLCVSSQVGCSMGCTFCATGTMGLMANLTPGEILEQLYHAQHIELIRGIVFMGMGEPLDNYVNVVTSIRAMTDSARFGLGGTRISISTVGVVPRILALIRDAPEVGFALSLHAPNQELRCEIVPTSKAWHITKIMDAVKRLLAKQNEGKTSRNRLRRILVEYVMISNINDMPHIAHELGVLLKDMSVLLNLIPYNPTDVGHDYKSPTLEDQHKFVEIVREYGVFTVLRQTMGQDIDGACGQLVIKQSGIDAKKSNVSYTCDTVEDLEDLGGRKKRNAKKAMLGSVKYASTIKREQEEQQEQEAIMETVKEEISKVSDMKMAKKENGVFITALAILLVALLFYRNM